MKSAAALVVATVCFWSYCSFISFDEVTMRIDERMKERDIES